MLFDPFLRLQGRKTLKNRLNGLFGPIVATFYLLFAVCFFRDFRPFSYFFGNFLINKASDEKIEGVPFFER